MGEDATESSEMTSGMTGDEMEQEEEESSNQIAEFVVDCGCCCDGDAAVADGAMGNRKLTRLMRRWW